MPTDARFETSQEYLAKLNYAVQRPHFKKHAIGYKKNWRREFKSWMRYASWESIQFLLAFIAVMFSFYMIALIVE